MIASEPQQSIIRAQKRYTSMALIAAVVLGGGLIISGYASLGKGFILGSLFSILNFILMALVIPYQIGHGRGKSFLVSLTSICGRFALMAIPLIFAVKHSQIAVSTVVIGLFIIPIAILSEHLWERWRHSEEVGI